MARRGKASRRIERALTGAEHLDRRQFLRLTAVGAGAVLVTGCGGDCDDTSTGTATVSAYRLSTHGERTCGACKAHGANRFYQTREAADGDRPHAGCNCRIVVHPISSELANQYFRDGAVFDKRRT